MVPGRIEVAGLPCDRSVTVLAPLRHSVNHFRSCDCHRSCRCPCVTLSPAANAAQEGDGIISILRPVDQQRPRTSGRPGTSCGRPGTATGTRIDGVQSRSSVAAPVGEEDEDADDDGPVAVSRQASVGDELQMIDGGGNNSGGAADATAATPDEPKTIADMVRHNRTEGVVGDGVVLAPCAASERDVMSVSLLRG